VLSACSEELDPPRQRVEIERGIAQRRAVGGHAHDHALALHRREPVELESPSALDRADEAGLVEEQPVAVVVDLVGVDAGKADGGGNVVARTDVERRDAAGGGIDQEGFLRACINGLRRRANCGRAAPPREIAALDRADAAPLSARAGVPQPAT
jgi:hypothetical protein